MSISDKELKRLEHKLMSDFKFSIEVSKFKGYKPTVFASMLGKYGARKTAKLLLKGEKPQTGYQRMEMESLKNHSVEAIVLKAEYKKLFSPKELDICKKRLSGQ